MVHEIEQALDKAGYEVTRKRAGLLLRLPLKVMTALAGRGQGNLVADDLATLESDKLQLVLHPSDLVINGGKYDAAHARATVTEQLAFSKAYLTWTKEANEMEDRLRALWKELRTSSNGIVPPETARKLQDFERDLREAEVGHEEWEVLFRNKLLVERGLLQMQAGLTDKPGQPDEIGIRQTGMQQVTAVRRDVRQPQGHQPAFGLTMRRVLPLLAVAAMTWFVRGRQDGTRDYREYEAPRPYPPYDLQDR
jgi:hypothetical protein